MPLSTLELRLKHVPSGLDIESESQIKKIPASLRTVLDNNGQINFLGTIEGTINWTFSALLANRSPKFDDNQA